MGVATYRASKDMPERLRNALPDVEDLSRPVRHARTYHRKPEGQEQHQEAKPKDQPHREEELRKREMRF